MSEWKVIKISPEDWANGFSEDAHKIVFKEIKPASRDRISYALLVVKDEVVIGYVTVREIDDETVYWQFGGVVPQFRRSITAVKCVEMATDWQRAHSKRIVTYTENTNLPMLKLHLSYGFKIVGTRTYMGKVMVDMIKELHPNGD